MDPLLVGAIACAALVVAVTSAVHGPAAAVLTAPDGSAFARLRRDGRDRTWTLSDADGATIAVLAGRGPAWLVRQRWRVVGPDGEILAEAVEDHLALAVLRRLFGQLLGILRPRYAVGDGHRPIGSIGRPRPWSNAVVVDVSQPGDGGPERPVAIALAYLIAQGPAL